MRRVGVTELKNQLSRYLRLVKQGETVEVLEHDVPIARISGLRGEHAKAKGRLEQLVRDGIVVRGRRPPSRAVIAAPPVPCTADAVRALVEERGDR